MMMRWAALDRQVQSLLTINSMALGSMAIILGTFNRRALLERAVLSIRHAVANPDGYEIIVVDGGSTDGSQQWLGCQLDVHLIEQQGPLTGAVAAFNLGFADAVKRGFRYVAHFNDDAEFVEPDALSRAAAILDGDPKIGAVAFAFNLRGEFGFEYVNGLPYSNFGLIRTEAGMAAAMAMGDPTGTLWWNPIYHTYGADSELGCWIWNLGFHIEAAGHLRVHDHNARDDLRVGNEQSPRRMADGQRFWARWPSREHILQHGPMGV